MITWGFVSVFHKKKNENLVTFGFKICVTFGIIYLAEVISYHWMGFDYFSLLALSPIDSPTFRWWQVFTFSLTGRPTFTVDFVWTMVTIYWLGEPVVEALGRFSFFVLFFGASLFSISTWWLCASLFHFMHVEAFGLSASTFAILLVFCRTYKTATVQLMWLLPIQAAHFLYFAIFASVVAFLAHENRQFGLQIGGLMFALIYITRGERLFLGIAHWLTSALSKMRTHWRRRRRRIRLVKSNTDSID